MKHLSILALCLACTLPGRLCLAQEASGKGKGIVGGGLVGAEVVMLTEAALNVKSGWLYLAGGVGGAAAGVTAGVFIEKGSSPRPPIYLFAGSLVLVIPTMVAVLSATAFEPPSTYRQDLPPDDEHPAEAAPEAGARLTPSRDPSVTQSSADSVPSGAPHTWALQLPTLDVRQTFSDEEAAIYGLRQATEFHVAVLNGVF